MRLLKHQSIIYKLNLIIVFVNSCIIAVLLFLIIVNYRDQLYDSTIQELNSLSGIMSVSCDSALLFDDRETAELTLSALQAKPQIVSACIYDAAGKIFAEYTRTTTGKPMVPERPLPDGHRIVDKTFVLFKAIDLNNERIGTLYMQYDMSLLRETMTTNAVIFVISALVALCAVIAITSYLQRIVIQPIIELTRSAKSITADGNYSVRVEKRFTDEIGILIDAFNNMLSQIESRDRYLEDKVAKRTAELKSSNVKLEREIVERKKAENIIRKSLEEKNLLIREIHHRIKNNMQIITSMLNLQAEKTRDKKVQEAFIDSKTRIRSMALIHELLYSNQEFSYVKIAVYVKRLCRYLCSAFPFHKGRTPHISVDVCDLTMTVDDAVSTGLVITELVTNSIKHAFKGIRDPRITLTMSKTEERTVVLEYRDNGTGINHHLCTGTGQSLGMRLMNRIVIDQLKGTITTHNDNGIYVCIAFLPETKQPVEGELLR